MASSHYWSCSKFADWVRGTRKPDAGTSEQWDEWRDTAKGFNPVRYWIAEEGLDYLATVVYFIPDKLYDLKYYINNRFVTRTNALTAHVRDISPGSWCDVGNRFLPCLFNELVEFVEVELAWWHIAWADKEAKAKYSAPFWASGWFRWRTWRCPQAGLDNLEWQRKLVYDDDWMDPEDSYYGKPTPQAKKAQEILDLYTWWTVTRPARPDPYEASGWTAHCEAMREKYGDGIGNWGKEDKKERAQSTKAHKLLDKMEADFEKEDEEMMIRLIKVRHGLWT